ncbi:hypothetical protein [Methyloversatilis discipulorum]|uniref:hypothetical protein n=1 Tax=Methyloversatilis discipulorum TaxID=1119528 RepID=UPI00037C5A5C|nr:hypothetical protein [Methyloversatilis discipulorum]
MRKTFNLPPAVQALVLSLFALGMGLNFVLAISPLWGWSSFLGWMGTIVLIVFAVDERKNIKKALANERQVIDRLYAFYLVGLALLAAAVNCFLLLSTG